MPLSLRPYRTSDLPALYLLDGVCFEAPFRFSRIAMRRFAEAKNAIVRLANEQSEGGEAEQLAGFCIVHLEPAGSQIVAYIVTLDVDPAFRKRGVARTLMESVETAATDAGAQHMTLHVWTSNDAAMRLYERLGYQRVRAATDFYGEGLDALFYRKSLSRSEQPPTDNSNEHSGELRASGGSSSSAS